MERHSTTYSMGLSGEGFHQRYLFHLTLPHLKSQQVHPWKLTCPLKRDCFNRKYIFQPLIFKGHVSFRGVFYPNSMICAFALVILHFFSIQPSLRSDHWLPNVNFSIICRDKSERLAFLYACEGKIQTVSQVSRTFKFQGHQCRWWVRHRVETYI